MVDPAVDQTPVTRRFLPALLVLFVGSGCAALIYEIVWFQLLELVIGSSAVSLGVLLGTFMGGMCLGSIILPRLIGARHHPLRVYALLELGIGAIGLLVLFGMPLVNSVYTAWAGSGLIGILVRGVVAGLCLLPPTMLMGATLPAISRWLESTPQGVSWLGFFYGGNIAGAVVGSVLAGFYLLRVYDSMVATYVAVALNIIVAVLGLSISRSARYEPGTRELDVVPAASGSGTVYIVIALSGMTALAAEVIWTRILSLLFGGTVYTFSLILAAFLAGLGIGSSLGSAIARNIVRPRWALAACQLLLCIAIAWTAHVLTDSLPYWPINPSITNDPWFTMQLDMVRCLWAVLPPAILWGASFPLALASVAAPGQDPARLVGRVYAANTIGAIIGSLSASFVLVAWIGSQHSQQVLIVVSLIAGLICIEPATTDGAPAPSIRSQIPGMVLIVLSIGVGALLIRTIHEVPGLLIAYGRYAATRTNQASEIIYKGEGMMASVAVSRLSDGVLNYHNAGKVQASSEPQDMRLQRMLGHLTTLVPEHPRSVMVIGFGAGATAGAASIDPAVERQLIVEIEPLVPKVVSTYFSDHNFDVARNPKVRIVIDDGRHYLQTTNEKFDGITSDPLDPWVKGAAMLYTKEFFEEVKRHLNPGGVVTLFVQLYESSPAAVKSELATFFEAFPNGVVFGNTTNGEGYDTVLLGQVQPTHINVDDVQARLSRPEYAQVVQSLRQIGFSSAIDLFSTFAGRAADLKPWLEDAAINRDRNLRLQYLAGLGLNIYQAGPIYSEILRYRGEPGDLFLGSEQTLQSLHSLIVSPPLR
ncbi:MAG: SAM-dependent methyltransferase [Blastocatellia bacterium]|nr:MAG: SAM-dependent methyltransferase [Blastocatellia bacterium]